MPFPEWAWDMQQDVVLPQKCSCHKKQPRGLAKIPPGAEFHNIPIFVASLLLPEGSPNSCEKSQQDLPISVPQGCLWQNYSQVSES